MSGMPLDPWHLWGTSAPVAVIVADNAATQITQATGQLARINYGRPETWTFLFGVEVAAAPATLVGSTLMQVDFDLIVGVGRSSLKIPAVPASVSVTTNPRGFCRFAATAPPVGSTFWTTVVEAPALETNVQPFLEHFPAQDIQCNARVLITGQGADRGAAYTLVLHSYFAPRTHIRPEWFSMRPDDVERYRGNENGGA